MKWKKKIRFERFVINLKELDDGWKPKETLDSMMIKAECKLAIKTVKGNSPNLIIAGSRLLEEFKKSSLWDDTLSINVLGPIPATDIVNEFGTECEGFYKGITVYSSDDIPDNEGYLIGNCSGVNHGPGVLRLVWEDGTEPKKKVSLRLSHLELTMLLDSPRLTTRLREYLLEKDLGFWGKAGFFRKYNWDHFSTEELLEIYQAVKE